MPPIFHFPFPTAFSWYAREQVKHPNACDLIGGGFLYSDRIRLLPANDDDLDSSTDNENEVEKQWQVGSHASPG